MNKSLLNPRNAAAAMIAFLILYYVLFPLYALKFDNGDLYNQQLINICLVSCAMIWIGYSIPIFDQFSINQYGKISTDNLLVSKIITIMFLIFLMATFLTVEQIPLISSLSGASADELSKQRGDLFKSREGLSTILTYLFTLFSMALMPYAIAQQFLNKSSWRYISLVLFFIFTISTLQKFLFINAIIPIAYTYFIGQKRSKKATLAFVFMVVMTLFFLTVLARGGDAATGGQQSAFGAFFSADYLPTDALSLLVWRSIAVPVFTATDTLHVFYERLAGLQLYGSTSSFLAGLMGVPQVNLERIVFDYQWGWNDVANANAVYFVDAFVNFGWTGVILISLFVGQSLRWFRFAQDEALRSLWPIYCFSLFTASVIGLLLSNGFLLVLFMLLFSRDKRLCANPSSGHAPHGVPRQQIA